MPSNISLFDFCYIHGTIFIFSIFSETWIVAPLYRRLHVLMRLMRKVSWNVCLVHWPDSMFQLWCVLLILRSDFPIDESGCWSHPVLLYCSLFLPLGKLLFIESISEVLCWVHIYLWLLCFLAALKLLLVCIFLRISFTVFYLNYFIWYQNSLLILISVCLL